MNKTELVAAIADSTELSRKDVEAVVKSFTEVVSDELKKKGVGVLFISSEMEEVLGMSDRILIFCDGRITGELSREEANQENILKFATKYEEKV